MPSDSGWDSCNGEYSEEEQGFILIEKPENEDRKNDDEKEKKEKDTDSSRDKITKKGKAEDKERKDEGITKKRGVPDGHSSSSNSKPGHNVSGYCVVVDEAPQAVAEDPPSFPAKRQAHITTRVDDLTKPPVPSSDSQQVDMRTKSSPKLLTAPAPTVEVAPPSGYRVSLRTDSGAPPPDQTGPPVAYDAGGVSPLFIGSASFNNSVHPCKIGYHLQPPVCVPYDGGEYCHHGHYDLLPFIPDQMEWVPTSRGRIPPGRRAIDGGHEEKGDKLYHALANMNGLVVPGKTGEHLESAKVSFDGKELTFEEYQILCWK